jgi:hypothetical protein
VGTTSISSGHFLPIRITVQSPSSPALATLLAQNVEAKITKRTKISLHGQSTGSREIVLGKATVLDVDTSRDGYAVVHLAVPAGEAGKEQSWAIPGLVEIMVSIRFCR